MEAKTHGGTQRAVTITSRHDRLDKSEKEAYQNCLKMLGFSDATRQLGCIYLIEREGDGNFRKVGISTGSNISQRGAHLQCGDPSEQRIVSIALFASRAVSAQVESLLKSRYRSRGLSAQGGTEWFRIERTDVTSDIREITEELTIQQITTDSAENISYISTSLNYSFFGVVILIIRNGQLVGYEHSRRAEAPLEAPPRPYISAPTPSDVSEIARETAEESERSASLLGRLLSVLVRRS